MEQVHVSDLDHLLLGRRFAPPRVRLSSRGYLFVCDDESVRDSAIEYLKQIIELKHLDFNAEPQGKKLSEMCVNAYGTSYRTQKEFGFDVSELAHRGVQAEEALVVDNFQDIGLLAARDVKLSLAFLRSLGRAPYNITVIAVGSHESLDLIDQDKQLNSNWKTYELLGAIDQ